MDPRHFSPKTKREAFKRSNGHCEKCTAKLTTGNIIYDHVIPWEISNDSSLENCQVLCKKNCDIAKTYGQDIPTIAKVHRIYDRAIGIKHSGWKLPAGRESRWSKKLSGIVILRQSQVQKHRAMIQKRYGGNP